MVTVTVSTERRSGVTYVTARIDNRIDDPVVDAHSVRLTTDVEPIWSPEQRGCRWEDGATTIDVPVGTVRGAGFATSEPQAACSIEVDDVRPATESSARPEPSPRTVLRALGDPRPPRRAVPVVAGEQGRGDLDGCWTDGSDAGDGTSAAESRSRGSGTEREIDQDRRGQPAVRSAGNRRGRPERSAPTTASAPAPAPVERWLARVDDRVSEGTPATREADRAHLRRVARRVDDLLAGLAAGPTRTGNDGSVRSEERAADGTTGTEAAVGETTGTGGAGR